jgi:hypothetical protein
LLSGKTDASRQKPRSRRGFVVVVAVVAVVVVVVVVPLFVDVAFAGSFGEGGSTGAADATVVGF